MQGRRKHFVHPDDVKEQGIVPPLQQERRRWHRPGRGAKVLYGIACLIGVAALWAAGQSWNVSHVNAQQNEHIIAQNQTIIVQNKRLARDEYITCKVQNNGIATTASLRKIVSAVGNVGRFNPTLATAIDDYLQRTKPRAPRDCGPRPAGIPQSVLPNTP